MNIVLIGYRGTGKTSIGRKLASMLGREFVDADVLITQKAGKTIKEIFAEGGEKAFRDLESAVIAELAGREELVMALGGGAVLRGENMAALKPSGRVIWLHAAPEVLHERIQKDAATSATRPNLTAAGGLEEVRTLLAARLPLYKGAADMELPVDTLTIEEAAERISKMI